MNFKEAAILGSFISKEHAEPLFKLLVNYRNISSSEAASRLNLHIRTVQDFMEAMTIVGILEKEEVYEKKRPYFRYSLKRRKITMEIDLDTLFEKNQLLNGFEKKIREKKNAGARFSLARNSQYFSSVAIWIGTGRQPKERKISLTIAQGNFLYNLPFPSAETQSIYDIIKKAEIDKEHASEILDIVELLVEYEVIEMEMN
ncbi:MAG: hypothetical protein HN704_03245 [Bacteroidetes bacterium]|jgi:predicted transcriptional regulator|nr:hypothetical protein [Bacteroidota bacterium]MBT6686974.1 hypothetical protein [Bacteroidota bacterium]MBT7142424.1 hypothetical protein [Bacteroidota bacterium]MBT7490605.1 hypothetical protein [Bacteroidota bacterium]